MFDEPTAGMSVDEVPVVLDLIAQLKQDTAQDHPAGRAQDGRGALARRPHHRAAQRQAGRRRQAGRGDRLAGRAGGLSRQRRREGAHERRSARRSHGVHTHIGAYHILHGVDFDVPEGELTMLLGRNGAGKTTTLRTIMGLWRASAARSRFAGQRHRRRSRTPDIARPASPTCRRPWRVFSDLTVKENLRARRARRRRSDRDAARLDLRLLPGAEEVLDSRAPARCRADRSRCSSIARAIIEPRKLILIDEPTKGLAPAIIEQHDRRLARAEARGATILLVEQNFRCRAASSATRVAVMDDGRIVHTRHDGGAGRRRGAAAAAARPEPGDAPMSAP